MRYPLRAHIVFSWRDGEGLDRRARGWTRNVSEEGALIASSNCPAQGDELEFTLRVPAACQSLSPSIFSMEMKARVVRILKDPAGEKNTGFAVRKCVPDPQSDAKSFDFVWESVELDSSRRN